MTEFLASLPLRRLIYKQRRVLTPAAAISLDIHRITGRTQRWIRPLDQRAYLPATAEQADAVLFRRTPDEVRALLGGAA